MTTEIFFSSNKLGEVTNEQLQMMLNRFELGNLISAEPTFRGVGKQTMFVRSTSGEYVLKGNPLFKGQFIEEKFFLDNLLRLTKLPIPSQYLIDETEDIFGWNYSLMSRLPGRHIIEQEFSAGLSEEDKKQIALLLAQSLNELHNWKVDQYGEFEQFTRTIQPFKGSYKTWLYNRIRYWLEDAKKYSIITFEDTEWVEKILATSEKVFDDLRSPTFVMGDFKPDNFLVQHLTNGWHLSGIFDFTTGYFADGIADLPKMFLQYSDNGENELAQQFINDYCNLSESNVAFSERFRVHMLHQLVLNWGCAYAIKNVNWDRGISFSKWAKRFIELGN
ncbi:aminoglycoside phosphotransferase family protein [Paenibacillus sp. BC26]|uniref:aminoglycoside phosphotransferase family protein n=1 Tax=Paenibacillus sp. BC26 TaxID=1881032 RepID=UPI0008EF203F|nr:aminoglycoside phosphotransferase family protein [Paenibacillus sp. BC26]SFS77174.1 Phosphotransferase enzyme family protein [Paenibacillus sp. BC26]